MNDLPPEQSPDGVPRPPVPPQRRRGGCRGCLMGCLVTFIVVVVLVAVVMVAGVFVLRQMFPNTDSVQQTVTCAVLRFTLNNAESALETSDVSAADKAEILRGVQQLRSQYDQQCGPRR